MKGKRTFFIAGGGTGGHVFPALSIATSLRKLDPTAEIFFVGTAMGLETQWVPAAGFRLFLLPGGKLNFKGRWLEKIRTLLKIPVAFLLSARLLLRYPPDAVIGVGGYASGPFVLVASALGFSTSIWEPNALPGLTNRWLSRFVDCCFTVFAETSNHLHSKNVQRLGMPVRAEVEDAAESAARGNEEGPVVGVGLAADRPLRILCTGGSQGARAVNNALIEVLKKWESESEGASEGVNESTESSNKTPPQVEVIHQIGSLDWLRFQEAYRSGPSWVSPMEFIKDMPNKMKWADLVIARAGASTVAELAAFGKAAVLIPLPGAEAHQEKNAEALAAADAIVMLKQKDLSPNRLETEIKSVLQSTEKRTQMQNAIRKFFEPRASLRIAEALVEMKST